MAIKRQVATIASSALSLVLVLFPVHVAADSVAFLQASVTVSASPKVAYGANVVGYSYVAFSSDALGEPDQTGALLYKRGWIIIELEHPVQGCQQISVWLARAGWKAVTFAVSASDDGEKWTRIGGGKCSSSSYAEYAFNGAFDNVRYVKVSCQNAPFPSFLALDAIRAKGGDA